MIDTSDLEIIYNGEAGQEEFGITFPYASSDDIKVYIADSDVPLAASEYSITNNKVVLSTPLEEAATVRITRNTPLTQETQYINQGTTDLTRIEHSFDKLTMIAQENHNSMATVDSRVNSNMSAIASSAADLAAGNVSANLSAFVDEAGSASSAIAGYVADINSISSAISSDVILVGGYVSAVNSASSYISNASSSINEMSGGISIMSGGISEISGNISGMSGGVSVMSSGIMDVSAYVSSAVESFVILSAGNGIALSGGVVSAKVDSSTIGFDSNGALSCSVSGSAIPYVGSNGIDVNGTVISARLDGSTISTNAAGELQCLVSGGGQTYTAGDGISISGGVVAATSTLLQDVPQVISVGKVAIGGVDSNGGYFYVWQSGATMGVSGNYRVSAGDSAVTVKTNTSTGMYLNSLSVAIMNSGRTHYSATTGILNLYGSSTSTGIRMDSVCTMKNRGDNDYFAIIHAGMSATSNSVGIVQPDNSTCTVTSGGILHCAYSAGSGIGIASGEISAKVDSSTIGFDSNGALSCSVSGGTYWAGAGITISGGVISANVDSSTVGFDASGRISIGSDVDYVIESYINGASWYRVYKSGWCEQGGIQTENSEVFFLKPFADTNYGVSGICDFIGANSFVSFDTKTTSGIIFRVGTDTTGTVPVTWRAWGYMAQGE